MIVNRKTVDPTDSSSPEVIQLETAMGAAIDVFEGAGALLVPRERFVPVKTTNELLVLRSDAFELAAGGSVRLAREGEPPVVDLDTDRFKLLDDFEERFSGGPPSLVGCERLSVEGDVSFGRDVVVRGTVRLEGPREGRGRGSAGGLRGREGVAAVPSHSGTFRMHPPPGPEELVRTSSHVGARARHVSASRAYTGPLRPPPPTAPRPPRAAPGGAAPPPSG